MAYVPRIFEVLDNDDMVMSFRCGIAVRPKAEVRRCFRLMRPKGGVRTPDPDRDPPEKLARFLLHQPPQFTAPFNIAGLLWAIRDGAWAATRSRLLPNLAYEDLIDPKHIGEEHSKEWDCLPEDRLGPVLEDLKALTGRMLTPEETKILLLLEWSILNLREEIQALIPASGAGADPKESEAEECVEEGPAPIPEGPQTPTPVPSDDFTALDKVLLRTAVDSVAGVEGSLPTEEVVDLIEEVIHLNTTRTKSYFHRGFLQALMGADGTTAGLEQNQERQAWVWSGKVIGLARRDDREGILDAYRQHLNIVRAMSEGAHPGAAQGAMLKVIEALLDEGLFQDACAILRPELVAQAPERYIPSLIHRGRELVRARRVEEAKRVIGKARELLANEAISAGCPPELRYECDRRWAQVLRAQGAFKEARAQFSALLAAGGPAAELHMDLALCAAKVHWLDELTLPGRNADNGALIQKLELARAEAEAALASGGLAPGAAYLLGINELLHRDRSSQALGHLELAYEMALSRDEVYSDSLFFNHLCLALSVAILLAMDDTQFDKAHELLHKALDDRRLTRLPLDLFKRAIDVIRAGAHPACLEILQVLEQRCPETLEDHLRNPEFLEASPAVLALLDRRSRSEQRSASSRWRDLDALLSARLKSGDREGCESCLAQMEELALTHERLAQPFLAVLDDSERSGAFLEDVDRLEAKRVLHQVRGRRLEEGRVVLDLARHALGLHDVDLALEYLDHAESLGLSASDVALERRWAAELAEARPRPQNPASSQVRSVSILFVGGNEIQARYDDPIRDHFRREDRKLSVEFIHPAWSSNWNADVEAVKRRLSEHQALVVMRFNRTLFGRHIRRLAGEHEKLWFPCTGHGRDSIIRAINRAAAFVRTMPV